jgi:hypothetical protein
MQPKHGFMRLSPLSHLERMPQLRIVQCNHKGRTKMKKYHRQNKSKPISHRQNDMQPPMKSNQRGDVQKKTSVEFHTLVGARPQHRDLPASPNGQSVAPSDAPTAASPDLSTTIVPTNAEVGNNDTVGAEPNIGVETGKDGSEEEMVVPARAIPFHPLAEIFPMLAEDRMHELALDIKEHGLLDAIVMHEEQILDGRCRYLACDLAGVKPKFESYDGDDPLGYVISRNLHRRHLSGSQLAMVAARVSDLKIGANQHTAGTPIGAAAKALNVSARSVTRAKEVLCTGVPELAKAVEDGEVSVSAAAEISRLSETEQREFVRPEGEGETASKRPGVKRRHASRRKPTARAKGDKTATAAEMAQLKVELADKAERLRKAEEELAIRESPPEAVNDAPPEHAQQRLPDERDVEMERLRTDLSTAREALCTVTQELAAARGEMPTIPMFLERLDSAKEAVLEDLLGTFERKLMPKLADAPAAVRVKFLDEVGRLVRGI